MPSIVPEDTSLLVNDDSEVTDTDSDIDSEIPALLVHLSTPVAVISSPLGYLSTPAIGHTVKVSYRTSETLRRIPTELSILSSDSDNEDYPTDLSQGFHRLISFYFYSVLIILLYRKYPMCGILI